MGLKRVRIIGLLRNHSILLCAFALLCALDVLCALGVLCALALILTTNTELLVNTEKISHPEGWLNLITQDYEKYSFSISV